MNISPKKCKTTIYLYIYKKHVYAVRHFAQNTQNQCGRRGSPRRRQATGCGGWTQWDLRCLAAARIVAREVITLSAFRHLLDNITGIIIS